MSSGSASRICYDGRDTEAIGSVAVLSRGARAIIDRDLMPEVYLSRLIERGLWSDAIRFLAHAMPSREAVWWGCLCVWHGRGERSQWGAEYAALRSAFDWVREPTADRRRTTSERAADATLKTAAGMLAKSASLAGVLHPDSNRWTDREPIQAARLAAGAVFTAAGKKPDHRTPQYLAIGLETATGANRWQ